jgi:hypothetical protein
MAASRHRPQEVTVFAIDVGAAAAPHLPLVGRALALDLQRRLLSRPRDEVAFVLFGCWATRNHLNLEAELETGGRDAAAYAHVVQRRGVAPTDLSCLALALEELPRRAEVAAEEERRKRRRQKQGQPRHEQQQAGDGAGRRAASPTAAAAAAASAAPLSEDDPRLLLPGPSDWEDGLLVAADLLARTVEKRANLGSERVSRSIVLISPLAEPLGGGEEEAEREAGEDAVPRPASGGGMDAEFRGTLVQALRGMGARLEVMAVGMPGRSTLLPHSGLLRPGGGFGAAAADNADATIAAAAASSSRPPAPTRTQATNAQLVHQLLAELGGDDAGCRWRALPRAADVAAAYQPSDAKAGASVFKGPLELEPTGGAHVRVRVLKKAAAETVPTLKAYCPCPYDLGGGGAGAGGAGQEGGIPGAAAAAAADPDADPTDPTAPAPPPLPFASHRVNVRREYRAPSDPDNDVPPEERRKAYRYGRDLVPLASVSEATEGYSPPKGLQLLGFLPRSAVPRHWFSRDAWCVLPDVDPGTNTAAATVGGGGSLGDAQALSALARALHRRGAVAVVRVRLSDRANQFLGALTPLLATAEGGGGGGPGSGAASSALALPGASFSSSLSLSSNARPPPPDALLLNSLPYADDLREVAFRSLDPRRSSRADLAPGEAQLSAAREFVERTGLGRAVLRPEDTPNPVLHRWYHALARRALAQARAAAAKGWQAGGGGASSSRLPAPPTTAALPDPQADPLLAAVLDPVAPLECTPEAAAAMQKMGAAFAACVQVADRAAGAAAAQAAAEAEAKAVAATVRALAAVPPPPAAVAVLPAPAVDVTAAAAPAAAVEGAMEVEAAAGEEEEAAAAAAKAAEAAAAAQAAAAAAEAAAAAAAAAAAKEEEDELEGMA